MLIFQESTKNSSLISSAVIFVSFSPTEGLDFEEPLKVPFPFVLKLQLEYSPIIPPPDLKTAPATTSTEFSGTKTMSLN